MRNALMILVVVIIALTVLYQVDKRRGVHDDAAPIVAQETAQLSEHEKAEKFEQYKELVEPDGFVNTDGITLGELVGKKVILVDIMTYSCINCQRTYPYLNAWYEKYKDQGLEIVGVHTPEFEFEKDIENVREAMQRYGVTFPVALDNEYKTWRAYKNRFWPRKYLIDIDGYIVYDHIGEGEYDETEKKIQELLLERAERLGEDAYVDGTIVKPHDAEEVNAREPRSPETYFGFLRNQTPGMVDSVDGELVTFRAPEKPMPNQLYLVGTWRMTGEFAEAVSEDARVLFLYGAQKVFIVASSEEGGQVGVRVDGEVVSDNAGVHVKDGVVQIQNEQLYRLIEAEKWESGVLELDTDPGVRFFAFTFG